MQPGKTIAEREPQHPASGNFLRDIVFGANDGVVTAIGFLVGISGTMVNQSTVIIAGTLTIVAGAASMALGNYLAVKSQKEFYDSMEKIERWEMDNKPDVERDEIREIYTNMGFDKQTVETLTKKVTSDRELWLAVMMRDELGLVKEESPKISGFTSIVVMALIGTIRWWLNKGSLGSKVVETITIGLLAAAIGYAAGEALNFFGVSGISI